MPRWVRCRALSCSGLLARSPEPSSAIRLGPRSRTRGDLTDNPHRRRGNADRPRKRWCAARGRKAAASVDPGPPIRPRRMRGSRPREAKQSARCRAQLRLRPRPARRLPRLWPPQHLPCRRWRSEQIDGCSGSCSAPDAQCFEAWRGPRSRSPGLRPFYRPAPALPLTLAAAPRLPCRRLRPPPRRDAAERA